MKHALIRIPVKLLFFSVVTLFTLFPNPFQLQRHLSHVMNLDRMAEGEAPELRVIEIEFREKLREKFGEKRVAEVGRQADADGSSISRRAARAPSAREVQREAERFIYEKVRYEWDWNTWGSADYMPTVAEMFEQARSRPDGSLREDCDGRAVMAASLMRRLGYESSIKTDLRHVWVETPEGKWMGPGRTPSVRSTPSGNKTDWLATISNVPVSLSYGIAVFPLWRELIIAATAYVLLLHRGMGWKSAVCGGVLILAGLVVMRFGYLSPQTVARNVSAWPAWTGLSAATAGLGVLTVSGYGARKRAHEKARAMPRGPDSI